MKIQIFREVAYDELYAYADELDVTDLREQIGLGGVVDSEQLEMPDYASFFTKGAEDYTTKTFGYKDPEGLRVKGTYAQDTNSHYQKKMSWCILVWDNSHYKMKVDLFIM